MIATGVLDSSTLVRADFSAIGTTCRIVATEPALLDQATTLAQDYLAELDRAASRFRDDSEVSALAMEAAAGPVTRVVSPMLGDHVAAALKAAELTDGLVDPTVGRDVIDAGYDRDIDELRRAGDTTGGRRIARHRRVSWRSVGYDAHTRFLSLPAGVVLDLGSTGKAHAADRIAQRLVDVLGAGAGYLVDLGGDIATSGTVPAGGWQIGVQNWRRATTQVIACHGQAVATSSTMLRTWIRDGEARHHIVDPRTGLSAAPVWAQVSVAAATALEANAASTASIILGAQATTWLAARLLPARLDLAGRDERGGLAVLTAGWPST